MCNILGGCILALIKQGGAENDKKAVGSGEYDPCGSPAQPGESGWYALMCNINLTL